MFRRGFSYGILSLSSDLFKPCQNLCSPFSSRSNVPLSRSLQNPRKPRRKIIPTIEIRYDSDQPLPEFQPSSGPHSYHVQTICSLLSETPSQTSDLNVLLKNFKNKLDSDLVLGVLRNYKLLGRKNTLEFFSWAGFHLGFHFEDSVIEFMADFLARRKLFDDLKCLLITVSSENGSVTTRTISICIRFLGRQGRMKEALDLFEEMESRFRCKPDNLVFNNMLYVLCKRVSEDEFKLMGFINIAFDVFRRIKCPDEFSYSNLIIGLCKSGELESAQQVFYEMRNAGLLPTRTAVNNLIGELCDRDSGIGKVRVGDRGQGFNILVPNVGKRRGVEPAVEIFWTIFELGMFPSAFVVNRLISKLCQLRKFEEALQVFKIVDDKKLQSVGESYTIVIGALCQVHKIDDACELLERMVSRGLNPKLYLYNSVIYTLCKCGNLEEAKTQFETMNRKRCSPDNVTYTSLINGYCRAENWEVAYGLMMEMLGLGWLPHFHTYNMVDSLVRRNGRDDLCEKLQGKIEIQLLHNHCKAGELEAAYGKFSSMIEKGIYPPIYTQDIFERSFRKAGKGKLAQELLSKIV